MKSPDVTGYLLDQAVAILKDWHAAIEIQTFETRSPKKQDEVNKDEVRVLKQEGDHCKMVLTIALF